MKRILIILITTLLLTNSSSSILALSAEQKQLFNSGIYYFNAEQTAIQNSCNLLVAGRGDILNEAQSQQIEANRPTYEQAANQVGVPWQMLAVIHLSESGLRRENPANGQGAYQFFNRDGGPYPPGPIDDAEFLRQTILAAEFVKNKAASANLEPNRNLAATGNSPDTIKDTFFSYNGRAAVYANQAAALGFNRDTQPFEGSPYVMNRADPQRDPTVEPTMSNNTWGQIKRDGGSIEYPANNHYGAYVVFAAITGEGTGNCNQNIGNRIVEIAQQELALAANEADGSYLKYTGGVQAEWCAYFVSWVLEQAGVPFDNGPIPQSEAIRAYGRERGWYYDKNDSSYTPQPGDIVVYREGLDPFPSHVNIVVSYNVGDNVITTIGGNESSTVRQGNYSRTLDAISGFVRIQ